jgi:hypothetical protein
VPVKNFLTILSTLLILQFAVSCSGIQDDSNSTAGANSADNTALKEKTSNDNAEELGLIVVMPAEPTEVAWREEAVPGSQTERRLKAAIRFEPQDADKIAAEAEKSKAAVDQEVDSEVWFPQELVAQSEMNEGSKLKGKEYGADTMLQQPYTKGRLVRIENTDYFILEAFRQ